MFSIGFTELLLIAVITLLVVGPEKLPETIRVITINLAKLKRFWRNAKRDVEREVGMDEIRREIHNAEVMEHLERIQKTNFDPLDDGGDTGLNQTPTGEKKPDAGPPSTTDNEKSIHERRPESDAD